MAEDRDIKIYIGKNTAEMNDFQSISEGIERNRRNGNIKKAKALGIRLAKIRPDCKKLGLNCEVLPASELYCIRVLLTFTADYSVRKNIPSDIVADAVSSSMYEYLKTEESGYYDNISDGSAFTFYLLALKKSGDIVSNIGEQFAKRCGTNSEEYAEMGAKIFTSAQKVFSQIIEEADFAED